VVIAITLMEQAFFITGRTAAEVNCCRFRTFLQSTVYLINLCGLTAVLSVGTIPSTRKSRNLTSTNSESAGKKIVYIRLTLL
jgi:hypothetical protein